MEQPVGVQEVANNECLPRVHKIGRNSADYRSHKELCRATIELFLLKYAKGVHLSA